MEIQMTIVRRGLVCGVMIAAATSVGFGQYNRSVGGVQQVPQGNALDASPQVGSGGSNSPISGYVPLNANNYVTGNVSGLGGFNSTQSVVNVNGVNVPVTNFNSGTQSQYQFRGDVGQNSSFSNWVRQSAGGLQTTPGSAGNAYYLPSSTVSTAQGSLYSSPYGSGFDSALVPRSVINPGANSAGGQETGLYGGAIPMQPFSGAPANPDARAWNATGLASPLFSGRVTGNPNPLAVDLGQNAISQNNSQNSNNSSSSPNGNNGNNVSPNGMTPNGMAPNGDTPDEQRAREKLAKPADLSSVARVNGQLDERVASRIQGEPENVRDANVLPEGQMLAQRSKVNDTYRTMMGELEKAQTEAKAKEAIAKANPAKAGKNGKGSQTAETQGNRPGGLQGGSGQDGNPATGPAMGLNGTKGGKQGNPFMQTQSTDPTKPGYRPKSQRPSRLDDMSTDELQAGKKVPELKSFGKPGEGAMPTPFDEVLTRAEGLLKDGKYLDAAAAYQAAMLQQPENPLAVMGRANAELGAGMYESAASDLKYIYTRRPELISVKYALGDYIPPQRQHQLLSDLSDLATGKGVGNTASFLLCYLDYNTGRDIEMQKELQRWEARSWKDSWQDVMKRALGNGGEGQ